MNGGLGGDVLVGSRVDMYRGLLNVKRPVTHGIITDFGSQELIWQYIFKSLKVASDDQPLLITEPVLNPRKNRELMAEKLYEGFKVPQLCISTPAILCMYSAEKTTGLIVDVGDGVSSCVPIVEGFAIRSGIMKTDLAGRDVTDYLSTLLVKTGASFCSSTEKEVVREIKEKACYVATDPAKEETIAKTTFNNKKAPGSPWGVYKLPDGTLIDVTKKRHYRYHRIYQSHIKRMSFSVILLFSKTIFRCCFTFFFSLPVKRLVLSASEHQRFCSTQALLETRIRAFKTWLLTACPRQRST